MLTHSHIVVRCKVCVSGQGRSGSGVCVTYVYSTTSPLQVLLNLVEVNLTISTEYTFGIAGLLLAREESGSI